MSLAPVERALRMLLIEQARQGRPTTYAAIATSLSAHTPVRLARPYSPLHKWLGAVSKFEHDAGRPLLSALVISKDFDRPGDRFFKFAEELGLEVGNREEFWQRQLVALFQTWPAANSTLVTTHKFALGDGRQVRVREYAGGAVRVLIDDPPYIISEAFLTRGSTDRAILKLEPRPAQVDGIDTTDQSIEVMSKRAFKAFEWMTIITGILLALPEEEKQELLEWEKTNVPPLSTSDWPGLRKYIGRKPVANLRPEEAAPEE